MYTMQQLTEIFQRIGCARQVFLVLPVREFGFFGPVIGYHFAIEA